MHLKKNFFFGFCFFLPRAPSSLHSSTTCSTRRGVLFTDLCRGHLVCDVDLFVPLTNGHLGHSGQIRVCLTLETLFPGLSRQVARVRLLHLLVRAHICTADAEERQLALVVVVRQGAHVHIGHLANCVVVVVVAACADPLAGTPLLLTETVTTQARHDAAVARTITTVLAGLSKLTAVHAIVDLTRLPDCCKGVEAAHWSRCRRLIATRHCCPRLRHLLSS